VRRASGFVVTLLSIGVSIGAVSPARGGDDEASRALAQTLFDDGVRLLEAGHCEQEPVTPERRPTCREALDKFRRAYAIYPSALGALRNQAFCERGLGMVASAMRDFREVARRAPLDPNPSKQLWTKPAMDEAERLALRVPRITIVVEQPPARLEVTLDGTPILPAAFGASLPIDPGDHTLVARAPELQEFRQSFEIEEREDKTLHVQLVPVPKEKPRATPKIEASTPILPWIVLGAGVVTTGVGLGLGFAAKSARDSSCDTSVSPIRCSDEDGLSRAKSLATASTIVTLSGAAVSLVGVGLLVFAPRTHARSKEPSVALSLGWSSVTISGAF